MVCYKVVMLRLKKTRIAATFFVTLMLISISVIALSPIVKADENQGNYAASSQLDGAILDHQLYYYIVGCFYRENIRHQDESQINDWSWLDNGGDQSSGVRGGMYSNVAPNCADSSSMAEAMGRFFPDQTGLHIFCQLEFAYSLEYGGRGGAGTKGLPRTPESCEAGKGLGGKWDGSDNGNAHTFQRDSIVKLLNTTAAGRAAQNFSPAQEYVRSYRTLMNACKITLTDQYDSSANPAGNNDKLYQVRVVTLDDKGKPIYEDWLGTTTYDPQEKPSWPAGLDGLNYVAPGTDKFNVPLVSTTGDGIKVKNCGDLASDVRKYAPDYIAYLEAHPDEGVVTVTGTDGSTGPEIKCADEWNLLSLTNPLDWLSCSVLKGFTVAAKAYDNLISGMLCINESQIFGAKSTCTGDPAGTNSTSDSFHQSWSIFRLIALGLLAIAGLVMIISQALGFELFDSYTIKRVLPRILIAGVAITLSWQLMTFAVTMSNALGIGVRALIYAPFNSAEYEVILSGGAGAIGSLFAGGAFVALGAIGLLSFVATALLAILLAFFVLVLRNILIVLLILTAPVAIAAYTLPNTEKYFKIWWDWLLRALLAFPIITAFIAIGHVFAAIASTMGGTLSSFIAFAAYFAPYFLIPTAFKMSGGALGAISGMVHDRGKGGFDRLKGFRQNQTAHRMQDLRAGSLHGAAYDRLGINNLGRRANAGWRGRFGAGDRGRAVLATDAGVQVAEALKSNPRLAQFGMTNDDGNAVLALSGGTHAGARAAALELFGADTERAERAVAAASGIGFTRANAGAALKSLAQNKSRAVEAGRTDIIRNGVDRLAGDNDQLRDDLVGGFAFDSRQAGRVDLGGMNWGLSEGRAQFGAQAHAYAQNLAGVGNAITPDHMRQAEADLSMLDGIGRTKVQDIVGGHGAGMQQAIDTSLRMLQHGDEGQRQRAATRLLEFQQNITGASEENETIINRGLAQAGISYDGSNGTVASQLADVVGMDPNDLSRGARIYGDEIPLAQRQQQGQQPPQQPNQP